MTPPCRLMTDQAAMEGGKQPPALSRTSSIHVCRAWRVLSLLAFLSQESS